MLNSFKSIRDRALADVNSTTVFDLAISKPRFEMAESDRIATPAIRRFAQRSICFIATDTRGKLWL